MLFFKPEKIPDTVINAYRKHKVFGTTRWNIVYGEHLTDETLKLNIPDELPVPHTSVELLFIYISEAKFKLSWSVLIGRPQFSYQFSKTKFVTLFEEIKARLKQDHSELRWLDLLCLLMMSKIFSDDNDLQSFACDQLNKLTQINDDVRKLLIIFECWNVAPADNTVMGV